MIPLKFQQLECDVYEGLDTEINKTQTAHFGSLRNGAIDDLYDRRVHVLGNEGPKESTNCWWQFGGFQDDCTAGGDGASLPERVEQDIWSEYATYNWTERQQKRVIEGADDQDCAFGLFAYDWWHCEEVDMERGPFCLWPTSNAIVCLLDLADGWVDFKANLQSKYWRDQLG